MSEIQLRLLPPSKPLLERLGKEFFRRVPAGPGVYRMSGEGGQMLYIGQSHNLRTRLNSYKNLNPERASRKLVRLVHLVRSITWEECPSTTHALLRENELLRLYKPRFNVMNTRPEHYAFVGIHVQGPTIQIHISKARAEGEGIIWYGVFKSLALVRSGCASLQRLWWAHHHQIYEPNRFPSGLLSWRPPSQFILDVRIGDPPEWGLRLEQLFAGKSDHLIDLLASTAPNSEMMSPFQARWREYDLEQARQFYRFGPQRCQQLCEHHAGKRTLIEQVELDDWLVLERNQQLQLP